MTPPGAVAPLPPACRLLLRLYPVAVADPEAPGSVNGLRPQKPDCGVRQCPADPTHQRRREDLIRADTIAVDSVELVLRSGMKNAITAAKPTVAPWRHHRGACLSLVARGGKRRSLSRRQISSMAARGMATVGLLYVALSEATRSP